MGEDKTSTTETSGESLKGGGGGERGQNITTETSGESLREGMGEDKTSTTETSGESLKGGEGEGREDKTLQQKPLMSH